jgi:hypothetical protein
MRTTLDIPSETLAELKKGIAGTLPLFRASTATDKTDGKRIVGNAGTPPVFRTRAGPDKTDGQENSEFRIVHMEGKQKWLAAGNQNPATFALDVH